jgi:PBSX family phage terminase large subunit
MMINFTKKQKEFWNNCNHRWNVKCGATRSGKTFLDYYLIPKRIRQVSGKQGLYVILGNTKSTLQRNIIEPLQNIWGDSLVSDIKSDNTAVMFGERVYCIGADKKNQVNRVRGSSIKYCYGDEVATWSKDVFDMLKSRLDKPYSKFDGTCNPENPNHWFKKFIDSDDIDMFYQQYSIYDNTFLTPDFVKNLEIEYSNSIYFDRYILGKWQRAEGIIFPDFANDPTPHFVKNDEVPKRLRWIEVGFDLGGNGSAYALTATAQSYDGQYYVLKSQKTQAQELNMQDIETLVNKFCEAVESKYGHINAINSDHIAVIVNSINDNTKYRACLTYKPPLEERPFAITKLLANKKLWFVEGECDDLIDELQNLVFDDKSDRTIPLDDGSMQIDTWDSFIYSISAYWNVINF